MHFKKKLNTCIGKTCRCRCFAFTYILLLTFKASFGIWSDISDCIYCVEINHSTNQMGVSGYRKSSSLTRAESGWSPRSDRLAPTAPQNVPFLPVLMNSEGEEKWMNAEISVDQVLVTLISCRGISHQALHLLHTDTRGVSRSTYVCMDNFCTKAQFRHCWKWLLLYFRDPANDYFHYSSLCWLISWLIG